MRNQLPVISIAMVLALGGCASSPETQSTRTRDTAIGAGIGASTGALIGAIAGKGKGAAIGAAAGAGLGAIGGNVGWGMGDSVPVLLALDAQVELAEGRRIPVQDYLAMPARPLVLSLQVPAADAVPAVFEKVGYRAAFSPARIRMALRWADAARGRGLVRVAAAAPDLMGRRLRAVEATMAEARSKPDLAAIRAACLQDALPEDLAIIASRIIAGHGGLL